MHSRAWTLSVFSPKNSHFPLLFLFQKLELAREPITREKRDALQAAAEEVGRNKHTRQNAMKMEPSGKITSSTKELSCWEENK